MSNTFPADKYEIIQLCRQLVAALKGANEVTRNDAYQVIANTANDSDYAAKLEPFSALCTVFHAVENRLAHDTREADAELQGYIDNHECQECGAEGEAAPLHGPYTKRQERLGLMLQCIKCGDVDMAGDDGGDYGDHAQRRAESGYAQ
jgi:hypothetical protein